MLPVSLFSDRSTDVRDVSVPMADGTDPLSQFFCRLSVTSDVNTNNALLTGPVSPLSGSSIFLHGRASHSITEQRHPQPSSKTHLRDAVVR